MREQQGIFQMEPTFTTRWFYTQQTANEAPRGPDRCALCGLGTTGGEKPHRFFSSNFTDYDTLRVPQSPYLCAACAWYLKNSSDIRRNSWWLTEHEAVLLDRSEALSLLLKHIAAPPSSGGYYLLTMTRRKHLALHARMNGAGNRVRSVRFETDTVTVDQRLPEIVSALAALRSNRHSWKEIESDRYIAKFMAAWVKPQEFVHARAVVLPWLSTNLLPMLRFLMTKKAIEGLEMEGLVNDGTG